MAPTPQAQQLRLRGERTLRVVIGDPTVAASGTTVFLVHGAGGRAEQWRFVWPGLLEAGHRVVAFDALGHGDSPAPRRWSAYAGSEWVADLSALMVRQRSATNLLVGHSYGALLVLGALLDADATIERALLLAPPAPDAMQRAPWLAYLPVPVLERMRPQLSAGFRAAAWGPDAPIELVDEETVISDRNSLYVFKALWRQWLRLDEHALATLATPVQLLVGEADLLTPPDGARRLAAMLPRAQLKVLARCGHQVPLERPEVVLAAILETAAA
jgi:pimeloyl-ACP methyl ester carboxylesterase